MIIKGYIFSIFYALLCLLFAFVLYKFGVTKKTTRKVVHILVGFEWVILNHFMGDSIHFLAVCLLFLGLLFVSHRKNLIPMISSDGDNAPGTVYYAVAMSIMATLTIFVPEMMLPFGIGVFCTSLGDGFAGFVGQSITTKINKKIYGNKTIFGTLANFTFCLASILALKYSFSIELSILSCVIISIFAAELELFVGRGLDNIAVTLGASFLSFFIINYSRAMDYIIPILLTPLMIAFAYKKKALTKGGIIAAIAVDIIISISLGNAGFCILLAFFVLGIISDKIKNHSKKTEQNKKKASECRSYKQVLANSIVATAMALLFVITSKSVFVIAFTSAFAEALADTFASGFGVFSRKTYDIVRFKPCKKGLSGGVSLLGTLFSLVGAVIIALLSYFLGIISAFDILIVVLCGFFGCVVDSILGSTIQVKYKCQECGEIIEKKEHCNLKTKKHSGISFVDNNVVNLFGTVFSVILSFILYM